MRPNSRSCSHSTGRACIQDGLRLELTANEGELELTLSANELAIAGAGSHSTATSSG